MFSGSEDAQIVHLRKIEGEVIPKVTLNFVDSSDILIDLDVKASDLLQSNGIIWVEGPTDRMYLNKWIELFSGGLFKEGIHYQVVYYGGRLLSHFTADTDFNNTELINLLLTNRNCAILMDSDKKAPQTRINATKTRIKEEFKSKGLVAWITKGKEIENYIPESVIKNLYAKDVKKNFTKYMNIKDYLENFEKGAGKKYENSKVVFAQKVIPDLSKDELEQVLDLKERITEIIDHIRKWNT
jgi:predicted ATP-dependent endonuclease of OLD family